MIKTNWNLGPGASAETVTTYRYCVQISKDGSMIVEIECSQICKSVTIPREVLLHLLKEGGIIV